MQPTDKFYPGPCCSLQLSAYLGSPPFNTYSMLPYTQAPLRSHHTTQASAACSRSSSQQGCSHQAVSNRIPVNGTQRGRSGAEAPIVDQAAPEKTPLDSAAKEPTLRRHVCCCEVQPLLYAVYLPASLALSVPAVLLLCLGVLPFHCHFSIRLFNEQLAQQRFDCSNVSPFPECKLL